MKSKIKIAIITVMVLLSIFSSSVFAETGKFTDIPVPPNSSGYADYTEEEAAEDEKEYEENKENTLTAEDYVGKSSDYYLKSLEVEGYKLEPKFNRQNDEYTIYVKDDNIDTYQIKSILSQTLPDYMVPNKYIVLDNMPLNSNGKIDRNQLKNMLQ